MLDDVTLVEGALTGLEYAALRRAVGWWPVDPTGCERGLRDDLYSIRAEKAGELVGCGRIVGDGGIYFYLQDVLVVPELQRRGLGSAIVDRLMAYIDQHARSGAFVALMAARGLAPYYERWGFRRRPDDGPAPFDAFDGRLAFPSLPPAPERGSARSLQASPQEEERTWKPASASASASRSCGRWWSPWG